MAGPGQATLEAQRDLTAATPTRALLWARGLLMALLVALMYSPAVSVALQVALLLTFVGSSELRARFAAVCRQPMVIGLFAFYLMLAIAVTYSVAPPAKAALMLNGWRKLLLLPAAAAVFDDPAAKLRFALLFVIATVVGALLSYGSLMVGATFQTTEPVAGIVVRNHATQGMFFAVGAFTAATLAQFGSFARRTRWLLGAAAAVLLANIVFVTFGRSGYVVLLACAIALIWFAFRQTGPAKRWIPVGVAATVLGVLVATPQVQQRMDQAVEEMNHSEQGQLTAMGVRVHFWRNTLEMIEQRPWLGVGTDGFETAYTRKVAGRSGMAGVTTSDPHNQFLKIAAEQGLIGLAVFLAFLGVTAVLQRPDPIYRLLALGVLLSWCATSMASSHFSTFSEGNFIFLWLGAMLSDPKSRIRQGS